MRFWIVLLLLWGAAWPALAARNLSIEQMEQLLKTLREKPDAKAAAELGQVQLTERVSPARLERWQADFPGPKMRETLVQMADMSAFLAPPASDVLPNPQPDIDTQNRILRQAVQYAENTMSRLPDFFATRETTHFEDTLSRHAASTVQEGPIGSPGFGLTGNSGGPGARGVTESLSDINIGPPSSATTTVFSALHMTGTYNQSVTYRGGREVVEEGAGKTEKEPALGLITHGEFGPILAQILVDALRNQTVFARWDQGTNGPLAVFRYRVPAEASHFRVGIASGGKTDSVRPAYHGEIAIDPDSGAIFRLSEMAEMAAPYQAMRAAIAVEYGQVTIGGHSYVCPVRGVAFSKIPVPTVGAPDPSTWPIQSELNGIAFKDYHEFRTQTRIIANPLEASGNSAPNGGEPAPQDGSSNAAPTPSPANEQAATSSTPETTASVPSNAGPNGTAAAPSAPAANPAAPAASESSSAPAKASTATPETQVAASATQQSTQTAAPNSPITGTVIRAQSRLVLVDVVVTDHDKPVKGLDRSRFHVFQDGNEVPITSFEENQPPATPAANEETPSAPALPENTYSNVPAYPTTGSVNVLLMDALNTPASDQEQVRRQMIKYLSTIKPGTPLAIFMLSSQLRMATGFTTDVSQLLKVLESQKGKPQTGASNLSGDISNLAPSLANNPDRETRWLVSTIQQFATDTQTYENDQRAMMTLNAFDQMARYLAAVQGRKNLIWFSGSFPIGLTPDESSRAAQKNESDYSSAVRETSDLLSAARVSVYPVDARGLMVSPTSSTGYIAPPGAGPKNPMVIGSDSTTNFAEQTSVEKDSMNTIATETGGHAYSMGNDLKATLNKITDNDSYYYSVSYVPPQSKPGKNGYHTIEVKVDGGKYQLAYRRGYYTVPGSNPANGAGGEASPVSAAAQDGAPPSTQILFRARVLPDSAPELNGAALEDKVAGERTTSFPGASHRYVVDLGLKPQDMPLVQDVDGKRTAQLQCDLLAYDDKGQLVNSLGRALKLNMTLQQYEQLTASGGSIPFRMALDLPTGEFRLRIVLYDPATVETGSLEIPLDVQSKQSDPRADASTH